MKKLFLHYDLDVSHPQDFDLPCCDHSCDKVATAVPIGFDFVYQF